MCDCVNTNTTPPLSGQRGGPVVGFILFLHRVYRGFLPAAGVSAEHFLYLGEEAFLFLLLLLLLVLVLVLFFL